MDGVYNFLEEDWVRDGAQDIPNELLNLSDHSDYAMESTSDLMDWSSLFGVDDNKSLFSDKGKDKEISIQDFADLFLSGTGTGNLSGNVIEKEVGLATQQESSLQCSQRTPLDSQNVSNLVQIPFQQLQNYQQVNQLPAQLFIQPQHSVQTIQIPQQQQIQIPQQQQIQMSQQQQIQIPQQQQIQMQIPQQQLQQILPSQQQLCISFQAASSLSSVFPQSQQIILQQNPQSVRAPQILLQPSQTQVIISPQQQLCIPPNAQKVQLLQQQPQQQMFILNGGSSGSNYVEPSQIVLTPVQQTQQNSIVIQQSQVPSAIQHQTIMVQIGNQLFHIQSPLVEKNSTNITKASPKNGLIKIRHTSQSNSPSIIADPNSASKVMASNGSISENKSSSRQTVISSNGSRHAIDPRSSSTVPFLRPKGSVSVPPASDHQPTSLTTPVAKVRPLECKTGVSNKMRDESESANKKQEKMKSALDKTTSNQGQSFNQSVLKSSDENHSSVSEIKIPNCSESMLSNRSAALNPHVTPSLSLSNNISSKPSNFTTAVSTSTVTFQSKQPPFSKDFLNLSVKEKLKIHLLKDQKSALHPDTKSPFVQLRDTLRALAPYHVYQTSTDDDAAVLRDEHLYEDVSQDLLDKKDKLLMKYQHIMLNKSMVHHESVEDVMLGRMFLLHEMSKLKEEKKMVQTDPDSFVPRPVLPLEEMEALYPRKPDTSSDQEDDDEDSSDDCIYGDAINDEETSEQFTKDDEPPPVENNHIIIKIKHHDGMFSASPSCKRPIEADESTDKVPPIKIARIRLKRIDADDVETDQRDGVFQVVESSSKPWEFSNASSKVHTSNTLHPKPHAVTAVVTPFHEHRDRFKPVPELSLRDSFSENKSQRHLHSPVNIRDATSPDLPQSSLPKEDSSDENMCFDLLDDDAITLSSDYGSCTPKQESCGAFVSDHLFSSEYRPLESSRSSDVPSVHSRNNDGQMFPSDSEEFLDSKLEIEMQSAIESILSRRTD